MSMKSLRSVASSFGLQRSHKKVHDVEQQSRCDGNGEPEDDAEDDESVFAPGGADGTKVRKRTYNSPSSLSPS